MLIKTKIESFIILQFPLPPTGIINKKRRDIKVSTRADILGTRKKYFNNIWIKKSSFTSSN